MSSQPEHKERAKTFHGQDLIVTDPPVALRSPQMEPRRISRPTSFQEWKLAKLSNEDNTEEVVPLFGKLRTSGELKLFDFKPPERDSKKELEQKITDVKIERSPETRRLRRRSLKAVLATSTLLHLRLKKATPLGSRSSAETKGTTIDTVDDSQDDVLDTLLPIESIQRHRKKSSFTENPRLWVKEAWRKAYVANVLFNRLMLLAKQVTKVLLQSIDVPVNEELSLAVVLKELHTTNDPQLSTKIRNYCYIHPDERSEEQMREIIKLLNAKSRTFRLYTQDQKETIVTIMRYEKYTAGTLILKEGHVANSFYIIISGQLEVFIIRDEKRQKINLLGPGDCLGRIHLIGDERKASVLATHPTEAIVVEKQDFHQILHTANTNDHTARITKLQTIPEFRGNNEFVDAAISLFQYQVYDPNEIIIVEGTKADKLVFIVSGVCRSTKSVPFIVRSKGKSKPSYYPCSNPNGTIQFGDSVVYEILCLHEIGAGNHFPPLPVFSDNIHYLTEDLFNRVNYMDECDKISSDKEKGVNFMSLIANTRCEVFTINTHELLLHSSASIILDLLRNQIEMATLSDLQAIFIEKQKWQEYKKSVVQTLIK